MLYLIALFIVPYLCFLIFGEGKDPFSKPRNSVKRARWRYGRAMALASIPGSVSIVAMIQAMEKVSAQSFAIGITISAFMVIAFSTSKITGFILRR